MIDNKQNDNILEKINFDSIDIEINVDKDISEDIKDYYIDKEALNKITLPNDFDKVINKSLKTRKKEKSKNIRYIILDMIIVLLILSPFIGIIYPKIFIKVPQVYSVFVNINEFLHVDNLTSILGIEYKKEIIEGDIESSKDTEYILAKEVSKPTNSNEAIKLIHSLANTMIEADYKWQCTEVTPETIELALEGVEFINDSYDRMHLRNGIRKWEEGDFSNAVNIHNYVWEMLDGNVGKAENLDMEEIDKIKNKYF